MTEVNVVAFGATAEDRDWFVAVGSNGMSTIVAQCPSAPYAEAVAEALRKLPDEELQGIEGIRQGTDAAAAFRALRSRS